VIDICEIFTHWHRPPYRPGRSGVRLGHSLPPPRPPITLAHVMPVIFLSFRPALVRACRSVTFGRLLCLQR